MATLIIPDSTYQRLQALADSMRLPLDEYLNCVATEGIGAAGSKEPAVKGGTPEWINAFDAWIDSHPAHGFIADDSRDAVYGEDRD